MTLNELVGAKVVGINDDYEGKLSLILEDGHGETYILYENDNMCCMCEPNGLSVRSA
jgi:hypothetical protein